MPHSPKGSTMAPKAGVALNGTCLRGKESPFLRKASRELRPHLPCVSGEADFILLAVGCQPIPSPFPRRRS